RHKKSRLRYFFRHGDDPRHVLRAGRELWPVDLLAVLEEGAPHGPLVLRHVLQGGGPAAVQRAQQPRVGVEHGGGHVEPRRGRPAGVVHHGPPEVVAGHHAGGACSAQQEAEGRGAA
ncbi:unnamed protein product, partial [Ectocarpus fasciculatus]